MFLSLVSLSSVCAVERLLLNMIPLGDVFGGLVLPQKLKTLATNQPAVHQSVHIFWHAPVIDPRATVDGLPIAFESYKYASSISVTLTTTVSFPSGSISKK
jgi:hypothetical protein